MTLFASVVGKIVKVKLFADVVKHNRCTLALLSTEAAEAPRLN